MVGWTVSGRCVRVNGRGEREGKGSNTVSDEIGWDCGLN